MWQRFRERHWTHGPLNVIAVLILSLKRVRTSSKSSQSVVKAVKLRKCHMLHVPSIKNIAFHPDRKGSFADDENGGQ